MRPVENTARDLLQGLLDELTQQRDRGRLTGAATWTDDVLKIDDALKLRQYLDRAYVRLGDPGKYRLLTSMKENRTTFLWRVDVKIAPVGTAPRPERAKAGSF